LQFCCPSYIACSVDDLLRPVSITLSSSRDGHRPAANRSAARFEISTPVCDRSETSSATSLRAGLRPASELDSVMEFGLQEASLLRQSLLDFIMAALRCRCGHYIFILWFLLSSFFLVHFPRLISAVADRMSTTLPHMVWS